jgi:YHS domain-containing protein
MRMKTLSVRVISCAVLSAAAIGISDPSFGHREHDHGAASAAAEKRAAGPGDPYLLDTDPVSGKRLPARPVIRIHDGRELRFSDEASAAAFVKDPAKYLKVVDGRIAAQQRSFYPLETCVASGEKLGGEMGPAIDYVYHNRLVRLCCKSCVPQFKKDPAKYIGLLDKAVAEAQKKTYKMKTCIVSGEELGSMGDPIDVVAGNRLVRLCCKSCVKTFRADATKYVRKLSS